MVPKQVLEVSSNRPVGHVQPVGDLLVREPGGREIQDLGLARRQAGAPAALAATTLTGLISWAHACHPMLRDPRVA